MTLPAPVSLPGTSTPSFVLFPSLFPPLWEAWAAGAIQGVPLHTEPTSLCSAPVSTTNNHGLPALIEALNNWEHGPTPPTKAELPSPQSPAATHAALPGMPQKLSCSAWKAATTKPSHEQMGASLNSRKVPTAESMSSPLCPTLAEHQKLGEIILPCNRIF